MRSFHELKAQTKQRSQITNLFRYLVKDLQEHAEALTAGKSDCSDISNDSGEQILMDDSLSNDGRE